jgi:Domain of unknown function (DUF5655)
VGLLRSGRKFAIVAATSERLDVGIKLAGEATTGRLTATGTWNAMVTHRAQLTDPAQLDDQVRGWLRQAYDAAGRVDATRGC